jgi:hypothetical protein
MEFEMATDDSNLWTKEKEQKIAVFGVVAHDLIKALDQFPYEKINLIHKNLPRYVSKYVSLTEEEIEVYSKEESCLEELSIEFPVEPINEDDFS